MPAGHIRPSDIADHLNKLARPGARKWDRRSVARILANAGALVKRGRLLVTTRELVRAKLPEIYSEIW